MIFVEPSYEILQPFDYLQTSKDQLEKTVYGFLELCGRNAYKSEHRITVASYYDFIKLIRKRKHESVLEHYVITVRFITSRDVTHELVRHRHAAYTQESQRFCNYTIEEKFDNGLQFIKPKWLADIPLTCDTPYGYNEHMHFNDFADVVETLYFKYMNEFKRTPQEARVILPNFAKSDIIMTANLREWRHVFNMRVAPDVYPEMLRIMEPLQNELKNKLPLIFGD